MAEFSAKEPNLDAFRKAVEDLRIKAGLRVEQIAKETAPVDTGNYRSEIEFDGANTITAQANYSAALEYGTQAREIKAVNAKALHFKDGGKDVFTKRVMHPGTKPQPVMRNAAFQTQKEIPQIWQQCQRENNV